MRFNLFATSLIVALSAAIHIEADPVADLYANELVAAQVDAEGKRHENWYSNGTIREQVYKRPEDHCCYLYLELGF